MISEHRILVCGVGSIGERHIRNLLALGYEQIAVYRTRGLPFRMLDRTLPTYTDLDTALIDFVPTVAFVTNPTALHLPVALRCAETGCHLFIEKPVSHTLEGLNQLQSALDERGRFVMVGYMLRFHPLLRQVKQWLEAGDLGQPLFARSTWGEHLPDWHPWEDYRQAYAASSVLGGGVALTLSHEIDLLVWMFGRAAQALGMVARNTPLAIDTEHSVDILVRFDSGSIANIHLDFCQRPPRREWELVCERARLLFDYYAGTLTRWDAAIGEMPSASGPRLPQGQVLRVPEGFDRNDLFLDELRYFFDCLACNVTPVPGIIEASESVRIALNGLKEV